MLFSPSLALPLLLEAHSFCLSEAKNAPDQLVRPSAFVFSMSPGLILFGQDLLFCLLSRLHEAFPISGTPQAVLSSKHKHCLLGWFTPCSLVLPPEVSSLKRNIHGDQNRGIWRPGSLWRDWAHSRGSDGTPGRRKSRLKQKMGKEKC